MESKMSTAFNLSTGERRIYSLSPEDAVIAAYAQSRGDWSTWSYQTRYSGQVVTGAVCVTIGNWSAFRRAEQERLWDAA